MQYTEYYKSPLGYLKIVTDNNSVCEINFVKSKGKNNSNAVTKETIKQLKEYFLGKRKEFNLILSPIGTNFQQKVWKQLLKIPFGEVITYGEIAKKVGNSKASRAVGGAINKNPIAVIVPCHRVIGKNDSLTGYAGGLDKKELLLKIEGFDIN